ncbi:expressed unknown protein [Seminavis robusta]|uniref:Uncharacterized protein n=1 Tax=Seminavis robusta TaxID=568900 RepID=A0A9N8HSN4_9STRA|nr:expressed unknown protein [Seminavis robusta]|eukprot:Sro1748_g295180.1 n/a (261) ;mRNA; r:22090-22872
MARLLPQLVKLDVNINWKLHGEFSWQTFTEALQGSRQLETLSLELWSRKCQESHYTLSRPVPLWVWNPLYAAIGSIPTLKTLYLATVLGMADSVGGIAITKTVVKVLGRNRLESLTLNGFRADLDIIFVALKQSVHLQHIDIKGCVEQNHRQEILNHVKAENATLTRIGGDLLGPTKLTQLAPGVDRMEPIEEVGVQINYYCGLNKLGRGLARDAATSAEVLVGLLKEAMRGDWNASWAPKKLGNVFGLLRENPSIWCKN